MNYFDEKAKSWDDNPDRLNRAKKTFDAISKCIKIKENLSCLDFGCGTGTLSFYFQPLVKNIDLVDTSKGMLDMLKNKIEINNIINMNINNLDILNDNLNITEKYDIIYSLMAVHHVQDIDGLIKNFAGLLNKNGYLCIADLVKEDGSFHSHIKDFDGHNGFGLAEIEKLFNEYGLTVEKSDIYYKIEKTVENGENKVFPLFLLIGKK